jgi:hypothetical protein
MKRFVGYHEDHELPVKRGDTVTILKGTKIKTTCPRPEDKHKVAKRTYKIKVDHILNGTTITQLNRGRDFDLPLGPLTNPTVRWGGTGGYWYEVEMNDLPEAQIQWVGLEEARAGSWVEEFGCDFITHRRHGMWTVGYGVDGWTVSTPEKDPAIWAPDGSWAHNGTEWICGPKHAPPRGVKGSVTLEEARLFAESLIEKREGIVYRKAA